MSKIKVKVVKDYYDLNNWEEVPCEDLWEDSELNSEQVKEKIFQEVIRQGVWRIIRRKGKWV